MPMSARKLMAVAALAAIVIAGCKRSAATQHVNLSSVEPLRAAFNADSGKVRAIFLASPT
jgi:hypothetical protein